MIPLRARPCWRTHHTKEASSVISTLSVNAPMRCLHFVRQSIDGHSRDYALCLDEKSGDGGERFLRMIRPSAWPRSLSRWVFKNKKNLSNQCYVKCRELIIIITKSKILRLCIKIKDFSSNCRDPVYIILYLYGNCEYLCL